MTRRRSSQRSPLSLKLAAAAAAVALAGALALPAAAAEKVRWKVPVGFATNLPALGDNIVYVAKQLEAASGGDIQFKVFEPGKLVPPFSITDAAKDKKIEAGYTWLGYDQGKIPSAPLFSAVPFGMEPWEFVAWWYEAGGQTLAEEIYGAHGVHPILCGIIGPEAAGWFRNEIKAVEDFKGLKIRFAGLGGRVLQKFGASVTVIPGGEIFQALEKGAIDATEFSMPAIDEKLGFDKIVKNYYFPGWHQTFTSFHLAVNKELWTKLAPASQALISMACTAGVTRNLAKGEAIQGEVLKAFKGKGVTARSLPADILRKLEKATAEVLEEESGKDAGFKKVYDSQKTFVAGYKNWKGLAFMPRDF